MSSLLGWFRRESDSAPGVLRERAEYYLQRGADSGDAARDLAAAAESALAATLAHDGGREAALDLLAADALVTLALKAQALEDAGTLGRLAAELRTREAGPR